MPCKSSKTVYFSLDEFVKENFPAHYEKCKRENRCIHCGQKKLPRMNMPKGDNKKRNE